MLRDIYILQRDTRATSRLWANRSYKMIVPDTNRSRRIPRSRRLHDVNPVKVLPRASPFASMIFYKSWSSFFSFSLFTIPRRISHWLCPSVSLVFSLTSFSTIYHHLRQLTDYCPTYACHTEESLMTPPFMNTDYSGEIGMARDYHERTPFRIRTKKDKKRGHKNVRVIFHLHACRNLNLFFLLLFQLRSGFLFSIIRSTLWLPGLMTNADQGPQFNEPLGPCTIFISLSNTFLK